MRAYRNGLFSLAFDDIKVPLIQCQIIVVSIIVETLNMLRGDIREQFQPLQRWFS
jgi:hypothetical protein